MPYNFSEISDYDLKLFYAVIDEQHITLRLIRLGRIRSGSKKSIPIHWNTFFGAGYGMMCGRK